MTQTISIRELVSSKSVDAALAASTKKEVLQAVATKAASLLNKDKFTVFDVLWERERLGTTGIGQSIAIPHARVPGLKKVFGFFARLEDPVNFEAIDDKPVDLVFLLLSPEEAGADHLHALASISRLLRNPKLCQQLRGAKDSASLYKILTDAEVDKAA